MATIANLRRLGLLFLLFIGMLGLGWGVQATVGAPDPLPRLRQGQRQPEMVRRVPGELLPPVTTLPDTVNGPQYGVNFISSAEDPADEQRYANALSTGATWNRWPFYWPLIERQEGQFDWTAQDATVVADLAHGLQINAILLGTPCYYQPDDPCPPALQPVGSTRPTGRISLMPAETDLPDGLFESIFADGTDQPGPGKLINPNNRWARFVYAAVERYRPGGVLAQSLGWPAGVGVTHWEVWNEPDLEFFWRSGASGYARLLKVGYVVARHADPQAEVLFGGLALFEKPTFYTDVLSIYDGDGMAAAYNYYHDIMAIHNYFNVWHSWYYTWLVQRSLETRGMEKPVWLNESGVVAWNDYPGPTWDSGSPWRATMEEQADFVIQSAFFATFAGADAIFHFQLYDGCGNQAPGTDFPPHDGELCTVDGRLTTNPDYVCAGDAFGLFSNPTDAACFTQHPSPESPRPVYEAFRVLTSHFQQVEPLWRLRPGSPLTNDGPQEWIAFYKPETDERVLGLWARTGITETAVVPALSPSALLVLPDGTTSTIAATNGVYTVTLPPATNQNDFFDPNLYAIGGEPRILIETDTVPPTAWIDSLPFTRLNWLPVKWGGDDGLGSGVVSYSVSVAVDGGSSMPWLTHTVSTREVYSVTAGHTYTFTVTAFDQTGHASQPVQVVAPALDTSEVTLSYLPLLSRP